MAERLTPAQKRHLMEMVELTPYWWPIGRGEVASARALHRKGLVDFDPARNHPPFTINDAGRAAVGVEQHGDDR